MQSPTFRFYWTLISKKSCSLSMFAMERHIFTHNYVVSDVFLSEISSKLSQVNKSEFMPVCTLETLPKQRGIVWSETPSRVGSSRRYKCQCLTWNSARVFCPRGHVICCMSLGSSKGRLVRLMLPNMVIVLGMGTVHWRLVVSHFTDEGSGFL